MRVSTRLLQPGERIHLVTREHGATLIRPFLRAVVTLALASSAAYVAAGVGPLGPTRVVISVVAGAMDMLALARLTGRVARWQSRRLIITDRAAMLVSGWPRRRTVTLPLAAIDEIEIVPAGRLLGLRCGALVVSSRGRRAALFGLHRLPDPDLLMALMIGLAGELPPDRPPRRPGAAAPGRPAAAAIVL